MEKASPAAVEENVAVSSEEREFVYQNRRYVGSKEIVAYILFDVAQSFNIVKYSERFILDVLHIDFDFWTIVTFFGGIWDVINDTIIGAIVDKTRTRWGKFKPYLMILAIPGALGTCVYWMLPVFFPNSPPDDIIKFIVFFAISIVRETADTFRGISRTGMLATISPHPVERTRLITLGQVFSLGEKLPEFLITLMIDGVNKGVLKIQMRTVYLILGSGAAIGAGLMTFYFARVARERIMQNIDRPSIKEGIISILRNKPILIITLSQFLSSFSLGGSMTNYYVDVLGNASLYMVVGIPGSVFSTVGYAWVPWFRRKFSTRFLWILGSSIGDFLMFLVFIFGSIGGKKNGIYKKKLPMVIAIMIQETIFMCFYGVRRVIPEEMYNEAMDYCEWKTGQRTEGMTGVAKNLASKLVNTLGTSMRTWLMKKIGYSYNAKHLGQSDNTKYYLFAMATALPFVSTLLGIIPKFFYDLSGERREKMYAELLARRALAVQQVESEPAKTEEK